MPALFVFYEVFQSTGSVWSPTRVPHLHRRGRAFSIHGLRVEPDDFQSIHTVIFTYFNPRAPCGARRLEVKCKFSPTDFSIHGLRVEPDRFRVKFQSNIQFFNPRAPCGARQIVEWFNGLEKLFNPRAPCGARRTVPLTGSVRKLFNPRAPCGARHGVSNRVKGEYRLFNPRAPCGARRGG